MVRKSNTPEQIVSRPREVEVLVRQGAITVEASGDKGMKLRCITARYNKNEINQGNKFPMIFTDAPIGMSQKNGQGHRSYLMWLQLSQ